MTGKLLICINYHYLSHNILNYGNICKYLNCRLHRCKCANIYILDEKGVKYLQRLTLCHYLQHNYDQEECNLLAGKSLFQENFVWKTSNEIFGNNF